MPRLNPKKTPSFPGMEIPMLRIRRSWDRLIFIMGIPILVRRHPILRRPLDYNNYLNNYWLQRLKSSSIGKCHRVHRFLFSSLPAVFHILVYIFKAELVYEICLESVAYGTYTNIFFFRENVKQDLLWPARRKWSRRATVWLIKS